MVSGVTFELEGAPKPSSEAEPEISLHTDVGMAGGVGTVTDIAHQEGPEQGACVDFHSGPQRSGSWRVGTGRELKACLELGPRFYQYVVVEAHCGTLRVVVAGNGPSVETGSHYGFQRELF